MPDSILIMPGGWEQEPAIRAALARGLEVLVADASETPAGAVAGTRHHRIDSLELGRITELARKVGLRGILGDQCDYSAYAAAVVASRLGLPGARIETAHQGVNKIASRERYRAAGIPQPRYAVATGPEQALEAARAIGFPVVTKPPDNRGCFGVRIARDPDELREGFFEALENSRRGEVLVEEMVEGIHITVDGYAFGAEGHRSLAVATKSLLPGPRPIVMRVNYPGELPEAVRLRAAQIHDQAARALGVSFGPTHGEYVIDAAGTPKVLEIANRGGGVLTFPVILPNHTGIDLVRRLLDDATGIPSGVAAPTQVLPVRAAVILDFFGFEERGVLRGLSGLDEARASPGVLALRVMAKLGEPLLPPVNGARRHGFAIVAGDDLRHAVERSKEARARLRVECA